MFMRLQKINGRDIVVHINTIVSFEPSMMDSESTIIKTIDGSVIYVKYSFEKMANMLMNELKKNRLMGGN